MFRVPYAQTVQSSRRAGLIGFDSLGIQLAQLVTAAASIVASGRARLLIEAQVPQGFAGPSGLFLELRPRGAWHSATREFLHNAV